MVSRVSFGGPGGVPAVGVTATPGPARGGLILGHPGGAQRSGASPGATDRELSALPPGSALSTREEELGGPDQKTHQLQTNLYNFIVKYNNTLILYSKMIGLKIIWDFWIIIII